MPKTTYDKDREAKNIEAYERILLKRLRHLIRMRRRWLKVPEEGLPEPWIKYMDSMIWDEQQAEASFWRAANKWYNSRLRARYYIQKEKSQK